MWKMLAWPSTYMNVDTTDTTMRCKMILHNKCAEGNPLMGGLNEPEVQDMDEVIFGGGCKPVWAGLMPVSDIQVVAASRGCVTAVCKTTRLMDGQTESHTNKCVLVRNIWNR